MSMTAALEAVLFVAGSDGLTTEAIANALQMEFEETKQICLELQHTYEQRDSGLALVELAGCWQLVTRPEYATYLRRMAEQPTSATLSSAALEVLAIVAYQQPISRIDIEAIRGVQSDRAIATLTHRQFIREVARQDSPGRPILYGTTETFLQVFGLRDISDLPPLPNPEDVSAHPSLFQLEPSIPRD